jgi:hypothetical protein
MSYTVGDVETEAKVEGRAVTFDSDEKFAIRALMRHSLRTVQ